MDTKVRKELETFKQMVLNWRESYLLWVEDDGNEWLIQELQDEISTFMEPQVRRFRETEYITSKEASEFWAEIGQSVEDFAKDVMAGKRKEKRVKVDVVKHLSQFNVHKSLIEGGHGGFDFIAEQKTKLADIAIILIPALVGKLCRCGEKCGVV